MTGSRTHFEYHQRSSVSSLCSWPGWARLAKAKPLPGFQGQCRYAAPASGFLRTRYNDVRCGVLPSPRTFDVDSLAILFELSLGLSAWKSYGGTRWALRCNPSSGNLHPTEGYLLCPRIPGLTAGVYHYRSHDHVLEQRAAVDDPRWNEAFSGNGIPDWHQFDPLA